MGAEAGQRGALQHAPTRQRGALAIAVEHLGAARQLALAATEASGRASEEGHH